MAETLDANAPITANTIVAAYHQAHHELMRELAARRKLGEQLAAWFKERPDRSDEFGAFQQALEPAATAPSPRVSAPRGKSRIQRRRR